MQRPSARPFQGRHQGWQRTLMAEPSHVEDHGFHRREQPREDCVCGGTEGWVTRVADAALLLARMDTDMAPYRSGFWHGSANWGRIPFLSELQCFHFLS